MRSFAEHMDRLWLRQRIASITFIVTAGILYITNFIMRAFVFQDRAWYLIQDFLFPIVAAASFYYLDWSFDISSRVLNFYLPRLKIVAVAAPVLAVFAALVGYYENDLDFVITVAAMLCLCLTAYTLRSVDQACIAIVVQTFGFVLLASYLGQNAGAIVTIPIVALVLLGVLPKRSWVLRGQIYPKTTAFLASFTLVMGVITLALCLETGVGVTLYDATFGRLGYHPETDSQCVRLLTGARFVGPTQLEYPTMDLFEYRILTYILAEAGYLAVVPLVLALVALVVCGSYLCHRNYTCQYYLSVSFLTVMAVQCVGYILLCAGWDKAGLPAMAPFLVGKCWGNTLFLLMALYILPPKRKGFVPPRPRDYLFDDNDEEEEEDMEPFRGFINAEEEDFLELDELDVNSEDYQEELVRTLAYMPRTKHYMEKLWNHILHTDPHTKKSWEVLLSDYLPFLDTEIFEDISARFLTVFTEEDVGDSPLAQLFSLSE